mgnify:CR=1 FL=1
MWIQAVRIDCYERSVFWFAAEVVLDRSLFRASLIGRLLGLDHCSSAASAVTKHELLILRLQLGEVLEDGFLLFLGHDSHLLSVWFGDGLPVPDRYLNIPRSFLP